MDKILYLSVYSHNARYKVIGFPKRTMDYFGLTDYISFAQDSKNPKQFYMVPGETKPEFVHKIYQTRYNFRVRNANFINLMYRTFDLSKDYKFKLLISRRPKVIDGIKAYPLMLDDCIYAPWHKKKATT